MECVRCARWYSARLMLERFRQYAASQHLFPDGEEVLLAVSGGRDSVALADLLHRCGLPFAIAHCNFHLRPDECDRDQRFVEQLAERLGVQYHITGFDTTRFAAENSLSGEEAARELRYAWFARLCIEYGYSCLATAHHRDDSIETFFLNLFRGTGIAGLHGIRPVSELQFPNSGSMKVVRPMLCFSRAEIDTYIAERGLEYVEDSTNSELNARRNRIRHQLMPLLRELYPSVDATMGANITRLSDAGMVFDQYVANLRDNIMHPYIPQLAIVPVSIYAISVDDIRSLNPRRTLLFELLRPFGFNAAVVDDILDSFAKNGRQFFSSTHIAELHRGQLLLAPQSKVIPPSIETTVERPGSTNKDGECFDADLVRQPLKVRPWHDGDRFCPLGMEGSRLVSDFLKDKGLSLIERQYVHLLVDADDCPLWVIGLRIDHRFRLTSGTTNVLRAVVS